MRVFYAQAVFGQEEIDAVVDVLKNRPLALMDGPSVGAFERRVAHFSARRTGDGELGSSANTLAIAALGLAPGSEVITPALTFSTTVAPLVQAGASSRLRGRRARHLQHRPGAGRGDGRPEDPRAPGP